MRKALLGSFALVPVAVGARVLGVGPILQFVLAIGALAPLAWLISEATDQAARRTGPAIGGLLNASFANVPELMIALFAVADGLFEVVRGSLTGSILGNLLLVLGLSMLVGGEGRLDRASVHLSLGLLAIGVPTLVLAGGPSVWRGARAG